MADLLDIYFRREISFGAGYIPPPEGGQSFSRSSVDGMLLRELVAKALSHLATDGAAFGQPPPQVQMNRTTLRSALDDLYLKDSGLAVTEGEFAVSSISGSIVHGGTLTIYGSGFGSKDVAAPTIWDDCSNNDLNVIWTGAWPNTGTSSYFTDYRQPIRGITTAHSHATKYICGCAGDNINTYGGWNVVFWQDNITVPNPGYYYACWYQRADPDWTFGIGDPDDNNYKMWAYSVPGGPYAKYQGVDYHWYLAYGTPLPDTSSAQAQWTYYDDANVSPHWPDQNGHNIYWQYGRNSFAQWIKNEMVVKVTSANDGYIRLWENGIFKMDYLGPTDRYPTPTQLRCIGFGGYNRDRPSAENWRYWNDLYFDVGQARVMLCSTASLHGTTLSNSFGSAINEPQIPVSWVDDTISVTLNLGKLNNQTAYLYVVTAAGSVTPAYSVTVP